MCTVRGRRRGLPREAPAQAGRRRLGAARRTRRRLRDLGRLRRLELRARRGRLGRPADRHGADGRRCTPAWSSRSRSSPRPSRPRAAATASARRALGPWGGFLTGTAILIEYAIAPAAIVVFIGGYVESLDIFGITRGWPVYLAFYAVFVGVHLLGVGEALKLIFVITAIAVVALVVFVVGDDPGVRRLEPDRHRAGRTPPAPSDFLPFGWRASGPRSRSRSGSSSPSRASRSPPRRRATRSATCRAG